MRLTALDIYQQNFRRRFRGYAADEVESFLEVLARDLEELTQENNQLRNRITSLDELIQEYRRKEASVHEALLSVERYGEEARNTAERETDLMLREARVEAETIIREAEAKAVEIEGQVTRMQHEKERFVAQYRAALDAQFALIHELQQMDFVTGPRRRLLPAETEALPHTEGSLAMEEATEIETREDAEE